MPESRPPIGHPCVLTPSMGVSGDLADGRVTQTELRRIEREAGELIGVVHVLLAHAGALAEQGRPAAAGGGATPIGTGRRAA